MIKAQLTEAQSGYPSIRSHFLFSSTCRMILPRKNTQDKNKINIWLPRFTEESYPFYMSHIQNITRGSPSYVWNVCNEKTAPMHTCCAGWKLYRTQNEQRTRGIVSWISRQRYICIGGCTMWKKCVFCVNFHRISRELWVCELEFKCLHVGGCVKTWWNLIKDTRK